MSNVGVDVEALALQAQDLQTSYLDSSSMLVEALAFERQEPIKQESKCRLRADRHIKRRGLMPRGFISTTEGG